LIEVPPPDVQNKIVLLKPNIVAPKRPESAVCTHPVIVFSVIKVFLERGAAKIYVGDSPMMQNGKITAKVAGIYDAVIEAGGEWVDFDGAVDIPCPEGKTVKNISCAKIINEVDVLISLPKLKSHQLTAYTGAMKNQLGIMVGKDKAQMHYRFPDKKDFCAFLTDINIAVKPKYVIMDSILAMSGENGPSNGIPTKVGVLAASDNILALDWMCASLVGYNPIQIENLNDALNRKVWLYSISQITLKGDSFNDLKPDNFIIPRKIRETVVASNPTLKGFRGFIIFLLRQIRHFIPPLYNFIIIFIGQYPHFTKKCRLCGNCIEICPKHAIVHNKKKLSVNKKLCIRCFCCHEICIHDAIRIKRF
jgi:uncharacterized protein (DUF362 family)